MKRVVKTLVITANLGILALMIGVVPTASTKAETLILDLDNNGALTQEVSTIINDIHYSQREDKDFFLIHPEKYPQEFCMAQNIFFEAGVDNHAGMSAVADVVLNRVDDRRYPDTVCGIVHDAVMKESWKTKQNPDLEEKDRVYYPVRNKCQFSWWCDGKSDEVPLGSENWVRAQMVAWEMMHDNRFRGITEGSTHYHATYVKPIWRADRGMELIGRIGAHIFYRWN